MEIFEIGGYGMNVEGVDLGQGNIGPGSIE